MFVECEEPRIDMSLYPEFAGDCTEEDLDLSKWFRYKDYYVQLEVSDDIAYLSIINLGKPSNVLSACQQIVSDTLKEYHVCLMYTTGYKSEVLIKRLVKSHKVICFGNVENKTYYVLEKEV